MSLHLTNVAILPSGEHRKHSNENPRRVYAHIGDIDACGKVD